MGSNDEFGPDTAMIRAWLDKRATYAKEPGSNAFQGQPSLPDPEPRWEGVTPETSPQPAGGAHRSAGDGVTAGRAIVDALRPEAAPATPVASAATAAPTAPGTDAARAVVEAVRADSQPAPRKPPRPAKMLRRASAPAERRSVTIAPRTTRTHTVAEIPVARALPRAVPPEVQVGRWTEPVDNQTAHEASTDVDFPVRRAGRMVLSAVLLVVLAATGVAAYLAWDQPTTATVGVAGTLGVLSLVVWAIRASVTTTQLTIHRGQLMVRRGGHTDVVDIASGFTPIAIVGRPGQRRWKVLIERGDQPLLTITHAMVDPHWFTTALYRLRADLRPEAQAALQEAAVEEEYDAAVGQAS